MPRILLADDSTHAQRMGVKILSGEGLEVVVAGTGQAAMKELKKTQFDLVLASVNMPPPTGYEICEFIKGNPEYAHIPVLLLVGAKGLYDQEKATQAGFNGLLKKPFEASAVMDIVRPLFQKAKKAEDPAWETAEEPAEETQRIQVPMPGPSLQEVEIPHEMADKPMFEMEAAPTPTPIPEPLPAFEAAFPEEAPAEPVMAIPVEAAAPAAAAPAEPTARWVAEPVQVSESDLTRFAEPPPAAPKPEAPPDWGELLKVVEEAPAEQPAPQHEIESAVNQAAETFAAVASQEPEPIAPPVIDLPELGVQEPEPPAAAVAAPAPQAPEPVPEPPAPEPAPAQAAEPEAVVPVVELAPEAEAAGAAEASAAVDTDAALISTDAMTIRDAVHASLDRLLPALVDEIATEVLRRLRGEEE